MLQGRLFNYGDTSRYRLGVNYLQLPVNQPFQMHNFSRDGVHTLNSQGGAPNYHPNSYRGPENDKRAAALAPAWPLNGVAKRVDNENFADNFEQPRLLYNRVLKPDERRRLIENIVAMLRPANEVIQERVIKMFGQVTEEFGQGIRDLLRKQCKHADL